MKNVNGLLNFIKESPTCFHACREVVSILEENGYERLDECKKWDLKYGGKYYVTRNLATVIAFELPESVENLSYNITAAHLDSPNFKLKPNFSIELKDYKRLNCEAYGSMIHSTWLDRPLNIAGRIMYRDGEYIKAKLINFNRPMCMIPNLAIHYNRQINQGHEYNLQTELVPIYCDRTQGDVDLIEIAADMLNINKDDILSHDLYLSVIDRGMVVGYNNSFIMAPQLDNLECSYALLQALISSKPAKDSVNVLVLFNNEEIGSTAREGAAGTMLAYTLRRISFALGLQEYQHQIALSNSFMVSADNAQGYHPNYASKYDPTNACYLNDGIAIKCAARGAYTSDAFTIAYFVNVCKRADAKYQLNTNRSDIKGGSTLGCLSSLQVSIPSIDIGLPQLAMHSAYETAGSKDLDEMIKAIKEFYSTHLEFHGDCNMKF